MQHWLLVLSLFICQVVVGQIASINDYLKWFDKTDQSTVKTFFQNNDYKLLDEKDSSNFHLQHYSQVKTEIGVQLHARIFLSDSAVEYLSFETYDPTDYRNITAQLKTQHFRSLGADVNGNFITTVYDNDRFLLNQDYESIENPLKKGQISFYGYRIYKKNGVFDEMNGEKIVQFTENGTSYIGIRENYKNGVLSGERTFYYPDGTIKRKENYQAGRLNGLVSDFDTEGKLTHSVTHSYHWKYGMEKWYNKEGKVVKTLQWQRDIPVGTEKYTINGRTFSGPAYKNGKREGISTIPVGINWIDGFGVDRFAIPVDLDWEQAASTVTKIKALETVNFVNNIKTGKAVGISPFSNDTLYTCYYKNGVIDSVFIAYQLTSFEISDNNIPVAQTTFVNGLENGKRTFWIRSGQYKDSVSYEENYTNGKLNGASTQFYSRSVDRKQDWNPYYVRVNFVDGILSGPFTHLKDSNNYQYGTYLNGKLDGKIEYAERTEKTWIRTTEYYSEGARLKEWVTENILDSIVVTENYLNNKKHGVSSKTVKGQLAEQRLYVEDKLTQIKLFDQGVESYILNLENESGEKFIVTKTLKNADTTTFLTYQIHRHDYSKSDTLLAVIALDLKDVASFMIYLDGNFIVETKDYKRTGILLGKSIHGPMFVYYKKEGITEKIEYDEEKEIEKYMYTTTDSQPYSGIFSSPYSNEVISVKDGLRNGWSIKYDKYENELQKTKYVKGIPKKVIKTQRFNDQFPQEKIE